MAARGFVAVVGSRELPEAWAAQVADVTRFFLERGWGIGSGGAWGADTYALRAVVTAGQAACARSVVFLPGGAPSRGSLRTFAALGGLVEPGAGSGRAALLARSRRLAQASSGVVAFLWRPSPGSVFTVRQAIRAGKPAAVVLAGGGAALPAFPGGRWQPCRVGPVAAFRWAPAPAQAEEREARSTWLGRVFQVPEGEPVHALMEHISSLSQGERLWFEQGLLAGDTVLVPHEALSDTPAFLALPRLRRRFRCSVRDAAGLAELFLALEAGPAVVAHYEAQARRLGVAAVIQDLVWLVAQLALAEECPETDALADAECLGEWAEGVAADEQGAQVERQGAQLPVQSDGESALLAWHALGSVLPERVGCPGCMAVYDADNECLEIPTCPECAAPNSWEARQGEGFRRLVAEIDGCPSLAALGALGKRLYGQRLPHDQAGVAWTHYRLRKARLESAVELGAPALALLTEVEQAPATSLPRLGTRLYRLQHAGGSAIAAPEWRRIWRAYHARRRAHAA